MSDTALDLAQVLWEERLALVRAAPSDDVSSTRSNDITEIYRRLNEANHWALCLSGGGIRSAAFALGIIQRFAAQPIAPKCTTDDAGSALQQFEYLSTVSGGGYIGSWLSAWLFQERNKRADAGRTGGANAVVAALTSRTGDHSEFESISNLRRDSHYLAPSFSAISADVWGDIAGIIRNLFLNWALLIPPMILAVLATKALAYFFIDASKINEPTAWFVGIMIAATLCFIAALSFSAANRPARGLVNASQAEFLICDLAIFLFGAMMLIFVLGSHSGRQALTDITNVFAGFVRPSLIDKAPFPRTIVLLFRGAVLGSAVYFVSWFAAPLWKYILRGSPQPQLESKVWHAWVDLATWCVAGAAFGILIAAGYLVVTTVFGPNQTTDATRAALVGVFGLPWIVSARLIADVIFIAFAEFIPGADAGLEYQARSGGIFTLAQLGWLIWFGLVLWAPMVKIPGWTSAIAATGGISGAFSVLIGSSSKTAAIVQQARGIRQYLGLNKLAAIAAAIFAAGLVAVLSIVMEWALAVMELAFGLTPIGAGANHPAWTVVAAAGAMLVVVIVAASLVISINRYSLHSLYRNRLVRAFLGASRDEKKRERSKNRFTDFDSFDSPLLHQLWQSGNPRGDNWKPLHVINAALNLVSSKNLAWQERMAAPFTFSPLHCGSGSSIFPEGAYRATHSRVGQSRPYGARLGVTLGTAMAISGAAVSPNMGYNTSPGVAFLMALFNVRLGWWLANPRSENTSYWRTKPRVALRPYFMEMFGLTSETERWVYVSDGGHFENLGLYEMVRRRCRVIVVSDAGCDPDYTFDDLGNALRKIWIDLGIRIDLFGLDRLKKRFKKRPTPATREPYWAVGHIRYDLADAGSEQGWLLYLKAGLHGTEPMDVLSYAMTHPTFPHETTANQFFGESQFESYRLLGFEIAGQALESGGCPPLGAGAPASGKPSEQAATTSLTLDEVIKTLGVQINAKSQTIYGLSDLEGVPDEFRL